MNGTVAFSLLLLAFVAVPAAASDYTVYATGQTNCTGFTDHAQKSDGPVRIYGGADTGTVRKENGFLKFDVSAIPDGTAVNTIVWNFYVQAGNWPYWTVTPVAADPASLPGTAALLWEDIEAEKFNGYYNYRNESSTYAPGWKSMTLGGSAPADLTALLAAGQDWFVIGGAGRDSTAEYGLTIQGHDGVNAPYLVVSDTPPPENDTCAGAVVVPGAPGTSTWYGDTTYAANDYDCSAGCVGGLAHGGPDVAYAIDLAAGCRVCVTLNQGAMDWNGGIYLVTDCGDVNGTCQAGSSGWLPGGENEAFCFDNDVAGTYYIIVDGRTDGGSGPFQLDVEVNCLPAPGEVACAGLPPGSVSLSWTNGADYELIEVLVDGELYTTLAGDAESVVLSPGIGYHCLQVCGIDAPWSRCSEPCCLIVGYDDEEVFWDFNEDDGGFTVAGTGGWEWGEATHGPCVDGSFGRLWATALHEDYAPNACWLLDSPPVSLGDFGAFLSIDHCYEAEFTFDGGTVWFTTDDFWYNTSEPLGGGDAYILGHTPLCSWVEGQKGFTGSSGGWVTDTWDLSGDTWKNQPVRLRFAFASDDVGQAPGWMIDNVTLYGSGGAATFDCDYTVTPTSGTVPFATIHRVTLSNTLAGGAVFTRRIAARIAVTIGNGTTYNPWRAGFTNVAPAGAFYTQFPVNIPALPSVIGQNSFAMSAMDVTPAPYNQPPYPASGDVCARVSMVTAQVP